MRVALLMLLVWSGLACEAWAQCPPRGVYYGGQATYAPYTPYTAYYAAPSYAPYRATYPNYPAFSNSAPIVNYGRQTTYFRGAAGPLAPPGGTFFGGYDYRITYPPDWYGGYWTWW